MENELERAMHAWIVATHELLKYPAHMIAVRLADESIVHRMSDIIIAVLKYRIRRTAIIEALKSEDKS